MDERKLLNRITAKRYVNLYPGIEGQLDARIASENASRIAEKKQSKTYYINVNIQNLTGSKKEKVERFVDIINSELSKVQFKHWIHDAISIDNALEQLNENLDKPALIIFHYFEDPENESELDILKSIRKYIQMKDSFLLGILIISSKSITNWDLFPYSILDERLVEPFKY